MEKPVAAISLQVEFTGQNRDGVSNKGPVPKPYWIMGAYALLPGLKYPQAIELFTTKATDVKPAGVYEIPLVASVKDGRPSFDLDLSAARPVAARAA
ncbi:TPA: hypothetical protein MNK97_005586 [Klebsiella pneumoniae]|nr:hypothetical protein [Klebsiella pneumoniae]